MAGRKHVEFPFGDSDGPETGRNREKRSGTNGVSFQTVYSGRDPDNDGNTIRVKGNPSLSEVKTVMIGVRNVRNKLKSGEVWVNELRLTDFNEEGGWAANANLNVALSDLGTVNVGGRIETAGFGALDQSLNERRMEDFKQYNVATSIELGKLFPEKGASQHPVLLCLFERKHMIEIQSAGSGCQTEGCYR